MSWICWVILIVLAGVAGRIWAWPVILKQRVAADRTTAISSLKGISFCMQGFEDDYGGYPTESTAYIVKERTCTPLDLKGDSSNRLFRQFLAAGLKSEQPYFTPLPGYRRGDDRFDDDAHALAPGETGFAYLTRASFADWRPFDPLVVAPLLHGTECFDGTPFANRAVVLRVDHSASAMFIRPDGYVPFSEGETLFNSKASFWKGNRPVIHWCEDPQPR